MPDPKALSSNLERVVHLGSELSKQTTEGTHAKANSEKPQQFPFKLIAFRVLL